VPVTLPIVASTGLTKRFTPEAGVFDLDLEIPEGLIVGFIGPSGSGKTTTVRLLTGLIGPDEGTVRVLGGTPTEFDANTRAHMGYMPQNAVLYPDLTLGQNLRFAASLYGMGSRASRRITELVELLDLEEALDRLPVEASGGERRRLMLAATLVHQPDLIFLDEPTAGIDPVLRRRIWDRLAELSASGASLIVTTQYVGEAAYCDYVAVLAEGRLLIFDTPEGLQRAATGGEVVEAVFRDPIGNGETDALGRAVGATDVERVDMRTLRLVVDDAGVAGPAIVKWAGEGGAELVETQTHTPSFDDVFVELVEKLRGEPSSPERNGDPSVGVGLDRGD
jgi:ABC-2 type transport system ATP-binding protein